MRMRIVAACIFALRTCIFALLVTGLSYSTALATANFSQTDLSENSLLEQTPPEAVSPDDKNAQSNAERLGELQESLEHDQKQLLSLEQEMENPNSEYAVAEKEFRSLKDELELTNERLEATRKSEDATQIQHLEQEVASLQRQRKLAEDRFDLAIEDRKTLREQRVTLARKIENDKVALAAITGDYSRQSSDEKSDSNDRSDSSSQSQNTSHNPSRQHDDHDDRQSHSSNANESNADSAKDKEPSSDAT